MPGVPRKGDGEAKRVCQKSRGGKEVEWEGKKRRGKGRTLVVGSIPEKSEVCKVVDESKVPGVVDGDFLHVQASECLQNQIL